MILCSNISCQFGRKILFNRLNLEIPAGRIVGLLGKNGEGKTSLLKLIAGTLFPSSGSIQVMDMDPGKRTPALLEKVFLVPEQIELPPTTAHAFGKHLARFYPTFNPESFHRFVDLFEIDPSLLLHGLSFGQRKKVLLSGALASGCPLVMLDEPTNGLDLPGKALFRQFLAEAGTEDATFILSTHQTRDLESVLDSVAVLHEGEVILNQTVEAINETLSFRLQSHAPGEEAVYGERVLGGYAVIDQSDSSPQAGPDIELLFSALMNNPNRIRAIFGLRKGQVQHG